MLGQKVCSRIREIRKSRKLTQSQFAELANLSEDSVGKIERGVNIPTIDTLYKISEGLNMPITDLIFPSIEKPSKKPNDAIDDLIVYLKTKSIGDVQFIHELAIKILERKKS